MSRANRWEKSRFFQTGLLFPPFPVLLVLLSCHINVLFEGFLLFCVETFTSLHPSTSVIKSISTQIYSCWSNSVWPCGGNSHFYNRSYTWYITWYSLSEKRLHCSVLGRSAGRSAAWWHANFSAQMYCSDLLICALIQCTEWPFPQKQTYIIERAPLEPNSNVFVMLHSNINQFTLIDTILVH